MTKVSQRGLHFPLLTIGCWRQSGAKLIQSPCISSLFGTALKSYELLVDKFNSKYSGLDENQKGLLNKYITNVNDTEALKEYIQTVIPAIKKGLKSHVSHINDAATRIKVERLSEMLCDVENINIVKESHVLNLLRYFDLLKELNGVHK